MAKSWEVVFATEADPSRKEFEQWQEQYWDLWFLELEPEVEILFRELSRGEFRLLKTLYPDKENQEDWICKTCILWPRKLDIDGLPAGYPEVIANAILEESGFSEKGNARLVEYMETFREDMKQFDNQVGCFIHEAFPQLDLEEIETWGMKKTLWYFSRAEFILNELQKRDIRYTPVQKNQPAATANKPYTLGEGTSVQDFPELAEISQFMKGKGPSAAG